MLDTLHENTQAIAGLLFALERSFDRSGVFYIGVLDNLQHGQMADLIQQSLAGQDITVETFQLHRTSLQTMDGRLQWARTGRERIVLVFWSLEHLSQVRLLQTLRDLCSGRERLSQSVYAGENSIPVVLLVSRLIYQKHFGSDAMDLDGAHCFFI